MWQKIARFILRQRLVFLIAIGIFTIIMGYFATKIQLNYDGQKLIPDSDPAMIAYANFKKTFGQDNNKVVIGFECPNFWQVPIYNQYRQLCEEIGKTKGVLNLTSPAFVYTLGLDTSNMFYMRRLADGKIDNQETLDSIATEFTQLKFYQGLLYNEKSKVVLMVVGLDEPTLNSAKRTKLIEGIKEKCEHFGATNKLEMRYSGLPFVRHEYSTTVAKEIVIFTLIAFLITALLILFFFRSMSTLAISLLFIAIGVITMLGISAILGFKLTLLTGTLPPLLVVIGVQNTIYLINKYHDEYRTHGNKAKALSRIISRIALATFLINFTTAVGFGTFYFTKTTPLVQFGIIAFITINIIYFINIIGIPALYSYLPTPTNKQTAHLENKNVSKFLNWILFVVFTHKRRIYFWGSLITIFTIISLILYPLQSKSYMVDDIPHQSKTYKDLEFFQNNFKGVMPLEIVITCYGAEDETDENTKPDSNNNANKKSHVYRIKEGAATSLDVLGKISALQKRLRTIPELSKPMSIAEVVCFANQAYNQGEIRQYRIPGPQDLGAVMSSMPEPKPGKKSIVDGFIDSARSKVRVSYQMRDVGNIAMDSITAKIRKIATAPDLFSEPNFKVEITGTCDVFLKGNASLYSSLLSSTFWALIIISLTMAALFPSIKMVIISVIPNVLPLFITAGIMSYFHIPLKPSTILVFSIAFGITIDATIHFMSTFRHELLHTQKSLREALSSTIQEVGLSMIYTMVALFAGYLIFIFSNFEGTVALGWLTAVTLLSGLVANLFLLPALILSFEKGLNPREELEDAVLDIETDKDE